MGPDTTIQGLSVDIAGKLTAHQLYRPLQALGHTALQGKWIYTSNLQSLR